MAAPLEEVFARFTTKVNDRALKTGKVSADAFSASLAKAGSYLAIFFGVSAVRNFVTGLVNIGDELSESAAQLGITTDALQELRYAAEQTSGAQGVDALRSGFVRLSTAVTAANQGNAAARRTFRGLGVELQDAAGNTRSMDAILGDVANAMQATTNQTDRLGIATKVFGRGAGASLLPLLSEGAAGVDRLRQEFRDLGGGFRQGAVEEAARADEALNKLNVVITSLKGSIAEQLLPWVTNLVEFVRKNVARFTELTRGVDKVRLAFILLSPVLAAIAVRGLALLLNPAGLIALAFIAIALAVEDLIHSYETGDGAIADFFQTHFDYDIVGLLDDIVEAWHVLDDAIAGMPDAWDRAANAFLAFENSALAGLYRIVEAVHTVLAPIEAAMQGPLGVFLRGAGIDTTVSDNVARGAGGIRQGALARASEQSAAAEAARERFNARIRSGLQEGAAARVAGVEARRQHQAAVAALNTTKAGIGATGVTVNSSVIINGSQLSQQQLETAASNVLDRQLRNALSAADAGEQE